MAHRELKDQENINHPIRKEYEKKLKPKITVIVHRILGILSKYDKYDEDQKSFTHTSIGAEIYYLPKKKLFNYSGKISETASKLKTGRSNEHFNVRKICGKMAVKKVKEESKRRKKEKELVDIITKEFIDNYGKYNITTQDENKDLREHQKEANFSCPKKPYKILGINLIEDKPWLDSKIKKHKT
jgi:hypothetical protein